MVFSFLDIPGEKGRTGNERNAENKTARYVKPDRMSSLNISILV
jgi:hypothetical protein